MCSLLGLLCTQVCSESVYQHSGHLRGSGSAHGGVGRAAQESCRAPTFSEDMGVLRALWTLQ